MILHTKYSLRYLQLLNISDPYSVQSFGWLHQKPAGWCGSSSFLEWGMQCLTKLCAQDTYQIEYGMPINSLLKCIERTVCSKYRFRIYLTNTCIYIDVKKKRLV